MSLETGTLEPQGLVGAFFVINTLSVIQVTNTKSLKRVLILW